jgi:hypothetical protein
MKVNIDFDANEQMAKLTFYLEELKSDRDFAIATSIVTTFSADFDLDPELERGDFDQMIEKARENEKECFTFLICEDGIEVEV